MRKLHLTIWLIAGLALISAVGVAVLRTVLAENVSSTPAPSQLVQAALDAMALDQHVQAASTQSAVRAAAVVVEQGLVRGPEANYVLAVQDQREMNAAAAEALFRVAIEEAPDWSWPYAGLGTLLGRAVAGRQQEAIDMLLKAIELEPDWAKPHNSLAVLFRAMGELERAEQAAYMALQLSPGDVAVQNNYANLMVTDGRFEEAEIHYLAAIDLAPEHPKPYYNLACLYSLTGRTEEALDALESAVTLAPILRAEAQLDPDLQALAFHPRFLELVAVQEDAPALDQDDAVE